MFDSEYYRGVQDFFVRLAKRGDRDGLKEKLILTTYIGAVTLSEPAAASLSVACSPSRPRPRRPNDTMCRAYTHLTKHAPSLGMLISVHLIALQRAMKRHAQAGPLPVDIAVMVVSPGHISY